MGRDGGGYGGINGDGDPTWGGEHTVQCTDDVLWKCTPESCIILLTEGTKYFKCNFMNGPYIFLKYKIDVS